MPASAFASAGTNFRQMDDGVLLRALLWLPSVDVYRFGIICRTARDLLADGSSARRLWQAMLETGVTTGTHFPSALWLHAMLDSQDIARYIEQTAGLDLSLVKGLSFTKSSDVVGFLAALEHDKCWREFRTEAGLSVPTTFLGSWAFPLPDLAALIGGSRSAPVQSSALRFEWWLGSVDVTLMVSATRKDAFTLSWQPRFNGECLMESMDGMEVEISGAIAKCCGSLMPAAVPQIRSYCTCNTLETGLDDRLGVRFLEISLDSEFSANDAFCGALLQGLQLECFAHIIFRVMGEDHLVKVSG